MDPIELATMAEPGGLDFDAMAHDASLVILRAHDASPNSRHTTNDRAEMIPMRQASSFATEVSFSGLGLSRSAKRGLIAKAASGPILDEVAPPLGCSAL